MSFKCGIVGLPNVGKSTLFNALTNSSKAQAANFPFCTIDPNIGIVSVPDHRIDKFIGTDYSRVRIGIGHPKTKKKVSNHVLEDFKEDEEEKINEITENIVKLIPTLINKKIDLFSSKVNQNLNGI